MNRLRLLLCRGLPIIEQLRLEEALFRLDDGNTLIINQGSAPSVVMGISGKEEELVHLDLLTEQDLPLIRRFSGGGTVVVDHNTLFCSWIGRKDSLDFPCFPKALMDWSAQFLKPLFPSGLFALRENDYVLGQRKFGGNAQSLSKDRFVHHSTLLWDYNPERMAVLKHPSRAPDYRKQRSHRDFLCTLHSQFSCQQEFVRQFLDTVNQSFAIEEGDIKELRALTIQPHRRSTVLMAEKKKPLLGV